MDGNIKGLIYGECSENGVPEPTAELLHLPLDNLVNGEGDPPPDIKSPLRTTLPIQGGDFRFGNILFTSKFDSGNLCRVEKVIKEPSDAKPGYLEPTADHEFNLWTRLDAAGTAHENGNRSWFYFGVRGAMPGKLLKMNIMNLNKQGKLYSQGHTPIYRVLPHRTQWDRLKDRCTFEVNGQDFVLTFYYRFTEQRGTAYFAFSFPWSYTESQQQMDKLDEQYEHCLNANYKPEDTSEVYYHRELFSRSLDDLRIDLLTISSYHGISNQLEPKFDNKLFPDQKSKRCRHFPNKRVFVLTSRVHPGESPASSVYNGFLEFILRPNDKRAIQLRNQYVFKLVPMLNPDGCVRGHYRTDTRGVNLNRLYLDPDPNLYPTIYAAKSLIVFHHVNNCLNKDSYIPDTSVIFQDMRERDRSPATLESGRTKSSLSDLCNPDLDSRLSSKADFYHLPRSTSSDDSHIISQLNHEFSRSGTEHLNHPRLRLIPHDESGVAFYVDLHGHASKRGCFIYGNHHLDEDKAVLNLLFPKLIALNSAHFDFGGCNFTERNMYMKDKRDGNSKEGSGRVAIFKSIGIVHSYTLECNYNSGRLVNSVANTPYDNVTPPPTAGFPPKYLESHYEEVGRALAIAAIDCTGTNPASRLQYSQYNSLQGVIEWLRKSLRGGRGITRFNKPSLTPNPKLVNRPLHLHNSPAGLMRTVKSEPTLRLKTQSTGAANNLSGGDKSKTGFSFSKSQRFSDSESSTGKRETNNNQNQRRSQSLPSPTAIIKQANNKSTVTEMNQTRSYVLRKKKLSSRRRTEMHTISRQNNTTVQVMQQTNSQSLKTDSQPENNSSDAHSDNQTHTKIITTGPSVKLNTAAMISMKDRPIILSKPPSHGKIAPNHTGLLEKAKELGVELDQSLPARIHRLQRKSSSGKRGRGKGKNGKKSGGRVIPAADSQKADQIEVHAKPMMNRNTQIEMDNFEQKLRQRISTIKHPQAYWVEL